MLKMAAPHSKACTFFNASSNPIIMVKRSVVYQVGAGAAEPVISSIESTGPQEQKRFISPYAALRVSGEHAMATAEFTHYHLIVLRWARISFPSTTVVDRPLAPCYNFFPISLPTKDP